MKMNDMMMVIGEHLENIKRITTHEKEEAKRLGNEGLTLVVVLDEIHKCAHNLFHQIDIEEWNLNAKKEITKEEFVKVSNTTNEIVKAIEMIIVNGKIAVAKTEELRKTFEGVFENIQKSTKLILNLVEEIETQFVQKTSLSDEEKTLEKLEKATNNINLLLLNNLVEVTKGNNSKGSQMVIINEIKESVKTLQEVINELKNSSAQKNS